MRTKSYFVIIAGQSRGTCRRVAFEDREALAFNGDPWLLCAEPTAPNPLMHPATRRPILYMASGVRALVPCVFPIEPRRPNCIPRLDFTEGRCEQIETAEVEYFQPQMLISVM